MAGTRRSAQADRAGRARVTEAVARVLADHVPPGEPLAVALSGGRDSVALLAAACEVARDRLHAIHVHHGLSAHADAWAERCARLTASLGVPLRVCRVSIAIAAGLGVEAAARAARYAALADAAHEIGARAVLLAHHQDDQAETLLLQLGRGAGPHGLAGMPLARRDADGLVWLRPLIDVPRAAIEAFVRARGLAYVDDDSNASLKLRRNALRSDVAPALARTFPGYPVTLARAAAHQAEAAKLLDELAAIDGETLIHDGALDRTGLAALAGHRARNLLRHFLRSHGLRAPSAARLAAMHRQLAGARDDARVRLAHEGVELGIHRGRIVVHAPPVAPYERAWHGEDALQLPNGRLLFMPAQGEGIARSLLAGRHVTVRTRQGGERLQLSAGRPRRALKTLLQEAGVPAWERQVLPLLFCDGALAAVPGLGVDVRFAAPRDTPSLRLDWQPAR
jgi:tRNA(Ile)-lysidine synthase